jgi:preprotein translocase subunit SecD
MSKIKKLFRNWRFIFLLIVVGLMLIALNPRPFNDGVIITSVTKDSAAALAGIESPNPKSTPLSKEKITAINNVQIETLQDYYAQIENLSENTTLRITTNKNTYVGVTQELVKETKLNETEIVIVEEEVTENNITELRNISKTQPKVLREVIGVEKFGLTVQPAPSTNLRKGLDLQGGTRVLLQPAEEVSEDTLSFIVDSITQRLNVFGLSDVVVTEVTDSPFSGGSQFILVEIAGATQDEVAELVSQQGKFEAKIGEHVVFTGGQDITYVCRTAQCSGLDPVRPCGTTTEGFGCSFRFSIALTPEAAQRQADITQDLSLTTQQGGAPILNESLTLFLDDVEVDSLTIDSGLKGRVVTEISITGGGSGNTLETAQRTALENMNQLQTVLITGSLPVKLNIVKIDNISPVLGAQFVNNALFMGLLVFIAVVLVVSLSYRTWRIAVPMIITLSSELIILLGMASLIRWNIDLAAIAGILVAIGTGVDDQIVITDEVLRGSHQAYNWKQKIKRAFFIIFSAYFTTVVAMIPLIFAGAGLLKGFALTTILGVTIGVLITRPAFAAMTEIFLEK